MFNFIVLYGAVKENFISRLYRERQSLRASLFDFSPISVGVEAAVANLAIFLLEREPPQG